MTSRLMSLVVWAAVAASAVYWCLRLWVQPQPVPGQATVAMAPAPAAGDLSRLLGNPPVQAVAEAAPSVAESRFRLLGVVAPAAARPGQGTAAAGPQATGLALISIDGKPPRAVAVGRELEPGLRLLAVSRRQADLGAGGSAPRFSLALPLLAEPNRGRPGEAAGTGLAGTGLAQMPGQQMPAQQIPAQQLPLQQLPLPQYGQVPGVAQRALPGGPLGQISGIAVPQPRALLGEPNPNVEGAAEAVNPALR